MQTPPAIVAPAPPTAGSLRAPWIAAQRPWGTDRWLARHRFNVARAEAGGVDVLFLGDSIVEFFATRAPSVWSEFAAPFGDVANFGMEGDRTQWLLWRIEHGEVAPSGARVVVLSVGTNNLETASVDAVVRGIEADLAAVRARLPSASVILCGLLPRGTPGSPMRAKAAAVNARIEALADGEHVRWLNAGARFLDAEGRIPPALMADALHPTPAGYEVWANALRPLVAAALSK
jgi:beta-glucosidase